MINSAILTTAYDVVLNIPGPLYVYLTKTVDEMVLPASRAKLITESYVVISPEDIPKSLENSSVDGFAIASKYKTFNFTFPNEVNIDLEKPLLLTLSR